MQRRFGNRGTERVITQLAAPSEPTRVGGVPPTADVVEVPATVPAPEPQEPLPEQPEETEAAEKPPSAEEAVAETTAAVARRARKQRSHRPARAPVDNAAAAAKVPSVEQQRSASEQTITAMDADRERCAGKAFKDACAGNQTRRPAEAEDRGPGRADDEARCSARPERTSRVSLPSNGTRRPGRCGLRRSPRSARDSSLQPEDRPEAGAGWRRHRLRWRRAGGTEADARTSDRPIGQSSSTDQAMADAASRRSNWSAAMSRSSSRPSGSAEAESMTRPARPSTER